MAQNQTDGKPETDRQRWSPRLWLRGLVFGAWLGIAAGVILGVYLGRIFPRGLGSWITIGMVPAMLINVILLQFLKPTKDETAARAAWFRRTFSKGFRRGSWNVGLASLIVGLVAVLVSLVCVSRPVFWVAFALLLLSVMLILLGGMAEPPKGTDEAAGREAGQC